MLLKLRELIGVKGERVLTAIAFLFLPIYMYIKVFAPNFGVKFSYSQILKTILKNCFIWASFPLLLFILIALIVIIIELNGNAIGAAFWLIYIGLVVSLNFLVFITFVVGIEAIMLSIKNFRFLTIGAILILSEFIFYPLVLMFGLPIG